jgi:hypothetical protein
MACTCTGVDCTQIVIAGITYCDCVDGISPAPCPDGCVQDFANNKCICTESVPPVLGPKLTHINIKDYLEEFSWTISYDPKLKIWLSFHDWHPEWLVPSYNHFLTIKSRGTREGLISGIWRHNVRTDSFANYYDVDYPWEVEHPVVTPNTITTIRSLEYTLDTYKYYNNGKDFNHVLDVNFDRAIVYNSEQNSGLLKLNLKAKNNPVALLNYPIINFDSIDIQFSKEENKYRFNQFYDITKDRGEYSGNTIPMWITQPNGYHKNFNPAYLDYNKQPLQHKKFRHYGNKVVLRKNISGDKKMILKFVNNKYLISPR